MISEIRYNYRQEIILKFNIEARITYDNLRLAIANAKNDFESQIIEHNDNKFQLKMIWVSETVYQTLMRSTVVVSKRVNPSVVIDNVNVNPLPALKNSEVMMCYDKFIFRDKIIEKGNAIAF